MRVKCVTLAAGTTLLTLVGACHRVRTTPQQPSMASAAARPTIVPLAPVERTGPPVAAASLRECLGEGLSWQSGPDGDWARSRPFPGPEAYQRWSSARACTRSGDFAPLLVEADLAQADSPFFHEDCTEPPHLDQLINKAVARPPVSDWIRDDVYNLEPDDVEHLLENSGPHPDPLAFDAAEMKTPGGVAEHERFTVVVLEIVPVKPNSLVACIGALYGPSDELLPAVVDRWQELWALEPYAIVGGGFVLHAPEPPVAPAEILSVAKEFVLFSEESGVWGPEVFVYTAAGNFWDFWWD